MKYIYATVAVIALHALVTTPAHAATLPPIQPGLYEFEVEMLAVQPQDNFNIPKQTVQNCLTADELNNQVKGIQPGWKCEDKSTVSGNVVDLNLECFVAQTMSTYKISGKTTIMVDSFSSDLITSITTPLGEDKMHLLTEAKRLGECPTK